jgi:dUTP pyrophosphatase
MIKYKVLFVVSGRYSIITCEVKMSATNFSTKIKRLSDKAIMPTKGYPTDSGWDLTVIGIEKIKGDTIFFKTGLQIKPPKGHYFEIYPRSSLCPLPVMFANSVGIIDENYRGELLIAIRVLHPSIGTSNERTSYPSGMINALDAKPTSITEVANLLISKQPKLAQMILRKRIDTYLEETEDMDETDRGSGGFGSTDLKQKA